MAMVEALLTAKDYAHLPDNGRPTELVRGRIVTMNPPVPRHGQICNKVGRILGDFAQEDLGHVLNNDSGVVTEHDPDTVRGADIAFYSYANVPKGPLPRGDLPVPPDVVFEVRSEDDRWKKVLTKVAEYLNAGVSVVCVLDEPPPTVYVYTADQPERILSANDEFTLPDLLPGLRVPIHRFFE